MPENMTKILLDTNILVSAALFPKSIPAQAYMKAVTPPFTAVVCDYSMDEFRKVFNAKFPHRIQDYERFSSTILLAVEIISTPSAEDRISDESNIRDIHDRPILRAAVAAKTGILITGDKDFLESNVKNPKIMTAAEFLKAI